jgi:hypothetical protein
MSPMAVNDEGEIKYLLFRKWVTREEYEKEPMTPIPDEFNYIAPKITAKMKKPSKVREAKNVSMDAPSRYGNDKKASKKKPLSFRSKT